MQLLLCWLSNVPNVIWSAIIASCLTLIGVFLTNRGNERRQIKLLEHESNKFNSQQKIALKKEVFLDAAKSFADVLSVIPNLMSLDTKQEDIDLKLKDHSGIVAKCYLVAREESVGKILEFSAEAGEVLLNLISIRMKLLNDKADANRSQAVI